MNVSFKESSMHGYMYRQIYNKPPSEEPNLCNYFWKIVAIIVCLPLQWINLCYSRNLRSEGFGQGLVIGGLFWVVNLILFGFGDSLNDKMEWENPFWVNYFIAMGILAAAAISIVLVIAIITGLVWLFNRWYKLIFVKREPQGEEHDLVVQKWRAFKGKYCPKIDWE